MILININIAIIIFFLIISISLYTLFIKPKLIQTYSFHPYGLIRQQKYYTFISSGFLHADFSHLIFNLVTYFFFAFQLESRIGSFHFFVLYFSSMIISDLPSYFQHKKDPYYYTLGASGAISAVILSYILFFPNGKLFILLLPFPIPAPIFAIIYLLFTFLASRKANSHINHSAHFWGGIFGFFYTMIFFPKTLYNFINYFSNIFN